MIIHVRKSFEKDIANVTDKVLARKALSLIDELEGYSSLADIPLEKDVGERKLLQDTSREFQAWN